MEKARLKKTISHWHETAKATVYYTLVLLVALLVLSNSLTFVLKTIWPNVGNNWLYAYRWMLACRNPQLWLFAPFVLHFVTYYATSLIFLYIDCFVPEMFHKYRVQKDVPVVSLDVYWNTFKGVISNQFFVSLPQTFLYFAIMEWSVGESWRTLETWPTFERFLIDIFVFLLVEEVGFYYLHRLAHHPAVYKLVHKKHHEFQAPIGMAAIYCHWFEHFAVNNGPLFFGPWLLGSHISTCTIWIILATVNTVITHSGYHLPLMPSSRQHDFHHKHFNQCFGVLGFLDWVHGTDTKFRSSEEFKKHVVFLTLPEEKQEEEEKVKERNQEDIDVQKEKFL